MDILEKIKKTQQNVKVLTVLMVAFFILTGLIFNQLNSIFAMNLSASQVRIFSYGLVIVGIYELAVLLPLHLYILKKKENEILKSLDQQIVE